MAAKAEAAGAAAVAVAAARAAAAAARPDKEAPARPDWTAAAAAGCVRTNSAKYCSCWSCCCDRFLLLVAGRGIAALVMFQYLLGGKTLHGALI